MRRQGLNYLVGLGVVLAMGCSGSAPKEAEKIPSVAVRTVRLGLSEKAGEEAVVGTVRARLRATLEAKASGRVVRMPVELGAKVAAGQVVAQLEAEDMAARLKQAEAVLEQTRLELGRVTELLGKNASTRQDYDAVVSRHAVAQAAVAEAQAMLSYATVRAPFAGVVTYKLAEVGDMASPGRPLLEIEDPGALRLEVFVPEAVVGFVHVGTPVQVEIAAVGAPLTATVAELAPAADPGSRTFLAKLDLPADPRLRTGQFARTYLPTGTTQTLRIPKSALTTRGQMEMVYVVQSGRAWMRLVRTGRRWGSDIEILAGLEAGEEIVVSDTKLNDGQPVEVVQ